MGANMVSLLGRGSELMGFGPLYPSNIVLNWQRFSYTEFGP